MTDKDEVRRRILLAFQSARLEPFYSQDADKIRLLTSWPLAFDMEVLASGLEAAIENVNSQFADFRERFASALTEKQEILLELLKHGDIYGDKPQ